MDTATRTELLQFKSVGVIAAVLESCVITLFALVASERNDHAGLALLFSHIPTSRSPR